ncbi:JmjC domain-containing protein [Streptomyces albidoflavus]|uniref:JmjC domain-containing protein n=1 Tax=Streptomyces albidoflavus TaxID=1886 RepID=UPI0033B140F4
MRDGKQVSPKEFTQTRRVAFAEQSLYADTGLVVKQFHEGSTIILKSLEEWHPPVRNMINELAALTGTQVKADVFFTPPHAKALVVHRDEFHIFAVQLHGAKDWVLQGVPEGDSWHGGPAPADTLHEPEEVTIKSGNVMFLEAGTAHSAKSQDTSSMHIAFEFRSFRITDRLDQVIREITAAEGAGFVSLDTDVAARQIRSALSRISGETATLDTSTLARDAAQKLIADSTRHGVTFGK